jgi:hypothetical protein
MKGTTPRAKRNAGHTRNGKTLELTSQRESNRWRVRLLYITTTDGCVSLTVGIIAGVFAFAWIGVTQGTLVSKGFLQAIENVGTLLRALHLI